MSILEFLDLVKKDPLKWINYCEIIILNNGAIELATPSHQEKLIELYCKYEGITKEQFKKEFPRELDIVSFICEKYSLISIWYRQVICTKPNRFQKRTLDLLKKNGLISENITHKLPKEYSWYLNNRDRVRSLLFTGK